jgi:glycosyltransferase involved in cell wall biosynthesis
VIRFSIILPVKNGGAYVKECVQSILDQTCKDWKLHVLDNCSTDETREWIRNLNNPQIELIPSNKPLTIEENWSRILKISKQEFCTLIGHDDLLHPHYLAEMKELIHRHPQASLYMSHFRYIDAGGAMIRKCKPMPELLQPDQFIASFLQTQMDSMGTGFMMRSSHYDAIGGIPARYPNLLFADFELWIKLASLSYAVCSPVECFSFRLHNSTTTTSSDIKMITAFYEFLEYLSGLTVRNQLMQKAIQENIVRFIRFYCKGLSHRLIRTPIRIRKQQTVADFIVNCKYWADRIDRSNTWNPEKEFPIRLALLIDRTTLFRNLFLLFRKIYRKPVYQ